MFHSLTREDDVCPCKRWPLPLAVTPRKMTQAFCLESSRAAGKTRPSRTAEPPQYPRPQHPVASLAVLWALWRVWSLVASILVLSQSSRGLRPVGHWFLVSPSPGHSSNSHPGPAVPNFRTVTEQTVLGPTVRPPS